MSGSAAALLLLLLVRASGSEVVRVMSSSASGCELLYRTGAEDSLETGSGSIPLLGGGLLFEPGRPVLSCTRIYVPVPAGADPVMTFSVLERRELQAARPAAPRAPALSGSGLRAVETAADPLPGPASNVLLAGVVRLCGRSFAAVDVYPWLGVAGDGFASGISIRLGWEGRAAVERPSGPAARIVPDGLTFFSRRPVRAESPFWGLPWARIGVGGSGPFEVTFEGLSQAGCDLSGVPSATLSLMTGPAVQYSLDDPGEEHGLEEVPILVLDGGDGAFGPGDRIRFLGRGLERWQPAPGMPYRIRHRWSGTNTYWLTWGGEPGIRMGFVDAAPDGSPQWGPSMGRDALLEEEVVWRPEADNVTGWVWLALEPGMWEDIDCSLPFEPSGPADVLVHLRADESGTKQIRVYVDGVLASDQSWFSGGSWTVDLEADLSSGSVIRVESGPSSSTVFYLDRIHVRAPAPLAQASSVELMPGVERTGRFTFEAGPLGDGGTAFLQDDGSGPAVLQGLEPAGQGVVFSATADTTTRILLVPAGAWSSPASIEPASPGRLVGTVAGADRLVVVPESLSDGLWGLLAVYAARGLDCCVATTGEIYDEFGQGVADPGAIRSAVRWALDSWEEPAGGVLLVGDGHYDVLGRTTTQPVMIFPWTRLGPMNPCTDDYYVVTHESSQLLPEVPVARLPVQTAAELLACVEKVAGQEGGTHSGAWENRVVITADDEMSTYSDNEFEHTVNCEHVAEEVLPRSVERVKFYMIEYPWPSGNHPSKPEAREDFVATLSRGCSAMLYIGHGGPGQIAHEGLMYSSDIDLLENGGRLPLMIWATCDVGRFEETGSDAIGEEMVLHPAGGALACAAATRGTSGSPNYLLARAMLDSLYSEPSTTLGEALWLAKLSQPGSYTYNNRYYELFGDPGSRLPAPDGPVVMTVEGDTLRTAELNTVTGTCDISAGLAFVSLVESAVQTVYVCLGGYEIEYLEYGGTAFRGSASVEGGEFSLGCLIPVQATAGPWGRASGDAPAPGASWSGADDPVPVVVGTLPGDDFEGPGIEMWIEGYRGIEVPEISSDPVVVATLSDTSGICFLGGSGRQLTLFVDSDGRDVGDWFSYLPGSTTRGLLEYPAGSLPQGPHRLILWCFDGAGNSSRDTLDFVVRGQGELQVTEALVYPNPGTGSRCFSFRLSEDAFVTVSIHTVAGRCIRRLQAQCSQGYNQVMWDGLDADGDRPATGAYVWRVLAETFSSTFETGADAVGVIAEVR
jgi:hypothetical protein